MIVDRFARVSLLAGVDLEFLGCVAVFVLCLAHCLHGKFCWKQMLAEACFFVFLCLTEFVYFDGGFDVSETVEHCIVRSGAMHSYWEYAIVERSNALSLKLP